MSKGYCLLFGIIWGCCGLTSEAQLQFVGEKKIYFGVSYYPEAWPETSLTGDIRRMKELNMNVVRMAEFSWSLMEPREGHFVFSWLHAIIDSLHAQGIDVILGTPTATPPAWLGEKYPSVYAMDEDGSRRTHGARRNGSYVSPHYIRYSERIISKMAAEFGQKPGVIGWQTDNEFNLLFDYSPVAAKQWHQWLQHRYGTIENLNRQWCTQLWSQTYSSFQQVPLPTNKIWHHPSLVFNWYRFWNDMLVAYQNMQIRTIRKYSALPITHDGMPGQKVDYEKLYANLDFMAVNIYHNFEAYDRIQSNYDRMRGFRKGMYWLFETAPNYSGGGNHGNTWFLHQPDGSMRAALWMNYALGGQGAMFWLWRQHWAGQEMVHGSVISAWNLPAANYHDIRLLGQELSLCSSFLIDHPVTNASIGIFWCHQNLVGLAIEEYANGLNYYTDWTYRFYRPLADAYYHRDVIPPSSDLTRYKLLLAPLMPYIADTLRSRLRNWVYNGGTLILGPMSGYRTAEWTSFTRHALGDISEWSGIRVISRIPVGTQRRPNEIPLMLTFDSTFMLPSVECSLWSEALTSDHGKILATYKGGMHNGLPAIISTRCGKGIVVFLGTDPGRQAYQKLIDFFARQAGCIPLASGEAGAVIAPREDGFVIVNLENKILTLKNCMAAGTDILTGMIIPGGNLELKPYQVLVIDSKK